MIRKKCLLDAKVVSLPKKHFVEHSIIQISAIFIFLMFNQIITLALYQYVESSSTSTIFQTLTLTLIFTDNIHHLIY